MDYSLKPRLYGKLPLQGDFIYQLPKAFTGVWDNWLQQGLAYSQDYFTHEWKDLFDNSDGWRFFLAPNIAGESAWLGLLFASHDKVGRRFPITLAVDLPPESSYYLLKNPDIQAWLTHLEKLTRQMIIETPQFSVEAFQQSLPSFTLTINDENTQEMTQKQPLKTVFCYFKATHGREKQEFYQYIDSHYLNANKQAGFSLWAVDESLTHCLFSSGLPKKELFGAFLDKDYDGWGWEAVFNDEEKTLRPLKRVKSVDKALRKQQPLNWYSSSLTDVGNRRTINEDNYVSKDNLGLWAIADGMGGYDSGDFASESVVEGLASLKKPYKMSHFVDEIEKNIMITNQQLLEHFTKLETRGGCTVVCLLTFAYHAVVMWAGDSRLYRYRDEQLTMLTRDHSEAEDAVERGEMSEEEAEFHPSGNVITRAVGIEKDLCLDMDIFSIQIGDILLLCSDGLYKEMLTEEIAQQIHIHSSNIDKISESLMSICLERRGRDNITLIVVKIG